MTTPRNPQSGYGCSGDRFMFRLPAIYPHTLYLPIEMKEIPEIQQLMKGEAPTHTCSGCRTASAETIHTSADQANWDSSH